MVPESPAQTQAQDISYAIGSTPNVLAFAEKIKLLPETQRKILAILLSDLILQPDKAQDIAPEVARLLGDQQPGKSFQPSFTTLKSGSNG